MASRMIRTALIDLSGTIHIEDQAIPGAIEAIRKLRDSGINVKFATNTTKESRTRLCRRLQAIGFDVDEGQIFTSLTASRDYIVEHQLNPYLLVDDAALPDFETYFPTVTSPDEANAVLVALAPDKFDYEHLNHAARVLKRGCPLIAIHKGRYYRTKGGLSLGPGPFVSALEFAMDCKAMVVGKPNPQFFLQAISEFGSRPEDCVVVGDDVRDDVLGGQSAGFRGILVKTGKYREGDERGALVEGQTRVPDLVCSSIVEAVDAIVSPKIS